MPNLSQEKLKKLAESANPGPYLSELAAEVLELRKDRERLDYLGIATEDFWWTTAEFPDIRTAIDAAMEPKP